MAALAGSIDAGDGIDEDALLDGLVKFVKKCITVDGFGWLHPDCLAHICTAACPDASHSGQALFGSFELPLFSLRAYLGAIVRTHELYRLSK